MYFVIFRKLNHVSTAKFRFFQTLKPLLIYGFPLALASMLSGMLGQFYAFMMPSYVKDLSQIGNLKVAYNFATLLTFVIFPISTVLFPAFSKLSIKTDHQVTKTVFASSVKYGSLLLMPATMALIVLSKPLIGSIYGDKWIFAPTYLSLDVLGNLLVIFGILSVGVFFSGLGETKLLLKMNLLTLSIGVPLGFLLIPMRRNNRCDNWTYYFGCTYVIIGLYLVKSRFGAPVDLGASFKILGASGIAALATYFFLEYFRLANILLLVVGASIFLLLYLFFVPFIGAINQSDISCLRTMFSEISLISAILEIPLKLMNRVLSLQVAILNKIRVFLKKS